MKLDHKWVRSLDITKPTILVDTGKVKKNIDKMLKKAQSAGIILRPHFKTHQSREIGTWFKDTGIDSIAVSSLSMAYYFASNGWSDITVAFPLNKLEMDLIHSLAQGVRLNLLVDSIESVLFLEAHLEYPVSALIEIDTGYGRTGLHWERIEDIVSIARQIETGDNLEFVGLLTHAGHSYHEESAERIVKINDETISRMVFLKNRLFNEGLRQCLLSVGDTPCCSIAENFEGINEIRPGNFVFYDLKQAEIGSCTENEIAIALACPVVSKYPDRGELVVYGGAVHFSKDHMLHENGEKIFGYLTAFENGQWGGAIRSAYVSEVSQEHGKLRLEADLFEKIDVGDVLLFLPVHSCLTTNLHRNYVTLEGKTISRFNSTF